MSHNTQMLVKFHMFSHLAVVELLRVILPLELDKRT